MKILKLKLSKLLKVCSFRMRHWKLNYIKNFEMLQIENFKLKVSKL